MSDDSSSATSAMHHKALSDMKKLTLKFSKQVDLYKIRGPQVRELVATHEQLIGKAKQTRASQPFEDLLMEVSELIKRHEEYIRNGKPLSQQMLRQMQEVSQRLQSNSETLTKELEDLGESIADDQTAAATPAADLSSTTTATPTLSPAVQSRSRLPLALIMVALVGLVTVGIVTMSAPETPAAAPAPTPSSSVAAFASSIVSATFWTTRPEQPQTPVVADSKVSRFLEWAANAQRLSSDSEAAAAASNDRAVVSVPAPVEETPAPPSPPEPEATLAAEPVAETASSSWLSSSSSSWSSTPAPAPAKPAFLSFDNPLPFIVGGVALAVVLVIGVVVVVVRRRGQRAATDAENGRYGRYVTNKPEEGTVYTSHRFDH